MISRRELLGGMSISALGFALGCETRRAGCEKFDDSLSVFVSDIHVSGTEAKTKYTQKRLKMFVDEVLAMKPLPRRVVSFGDLAYLWGRAEDYATSKPELKRLEEAGIELVFCMGNHDRRSEFAKAWPGHLELSPVPGKFVRVVSLGTADLVVLDCIQGQDNRPLNDMGPGSGKLTPDVIKWIKEDLPKRKRPFLVSSHFPIHELRLSAKPEVSLARWLLDNAPMCMGYVHGHDHRWRPEWAKASWSSAKTLRTLCLPSGGLWGDIGYVVCRSFSDRVVCSLQARDFYFPVEPQSGKRLAAWKQRLEEAKGGSVTFIYEQQPATLA